MTKPTYSEVEPTWEDEAKKYLATMQPKVRDKYLADFDVIVLMAFFAEKMVNEQVSELESELARVRGLLQRAQVYATHTEGGCNWQHCECGYAEWRAESADIGKLDGADKSAQVEILRIAKERLRKLVGDSSSLLPMISRVEAHFARCKAGGTESGVEMGKVNRVDEKVSAEKCPDCAGRGYTCERVPMGGYGHHNVQCWTCKGTGKLAGSAETGGEKA